ncbi:MAG: hypothetical protein C0402_00355 [Thermodesulfovibrio sp.]|nr:hypothetical protein [Thermodesulfovibrio sp.]
MDQVPVGKIIHKYSIVRATALIVLVGFCLFAGTAHTAVPGEADLFEKAYGLYQSGDHEKATELFGIFLKEYPGSSVLDSVLFWQAKSFIQLKKTDSAKVLLDRLLHDYPHSTFLGFARQELEVMRQTIPSGTEIPSVVAETRTQRQKEPDSCAENMKKTEDRLRSLKDQVADSYAKNQSLENELTAAIKDKQYLRSVIDELKQAGQSAPRSPAEVALLKADNERLQQELRALLSRQPARDVPDTSVKQGETEKRLAEIEQKRSETEIQARKAIADRAVIEGQLKEKERKRPCNGSRQRLRSRRPCWQSSSGR